MEVDQKQEFKLLKSWLDGLLSLQINDKNPRFDGGILCPSCLHLHGRIADAIYPLCYMADVTKESKYLKAAEKMFAWADNLYREDGSYYNDAQQTWTNTTIFFAESLYSVLTHHRKVLSSVTLNKWEARLKEMAEWMYRSFDIDNTANGNYFAAGCSAMAKLGKYFHEEKYLQRSVALKDECLKFLTPDNFLAGEGHQKNYVTNKGCASVDLGYSIEETLPALTDYAFLMKDEELQEKMYTVATNYLDFILPDGGINNSFGTRNFKWTYWGSRTSDGFLKTFLQFYQISGNHKFLKAVKANLSLLKTCTLDGFLYGGPDYYCHHEEPCIHHQFAHSKTLAACLDLPEVKLIPEFKDNHTSEKISYYPSIGTFRYQNDFIYTTISASDYKYVQQMMVSGGSMNFLYHKNYGPVIASGSITEPTQEPLNIQLSREVKTIRSSVWKLSYLKNQTEYSQMYDLNASLTNKDNLIKSVFHFCDKNFLPDEKMQGEILYEIEENSVHWHIELQGNESVKLTLPIICHPEEIKKEVAKEFITVRNNCELRIQTSLPVQNYHDGFSFSPGFIFRILEIEIPAGEKLDLKFTFEKMVK